MLRPPLVLGGMFATGVGLGAFATWWWLQVGPVAVAPGTPSPAVASVESRGAELQAGNVDAAFLPARLDEIASRLRSLEASVQELAANPARTPAVAAASGPAPVVIDVESLKQALARIERDKLAALSDVELLRRARMIGKDGGDLDAAADGLRLVLDRTASSTTRSEVQLQLAMLQRQRETPEALAESAARLQSVVQAHGVASELGMRATYQLVWTASQQRDLTSALAHAERYASAPNAKPSQRAEGRWAAAVVTQQLGSPEQARAAFDGWLRQFGADPELQKLVLDVQTRRAKLWSKRGCSSWSPGRSSPMVHPRPAASAAADARSIEARCAGPIELRQDAKGSHRVAPTIFVAPRKWSGELPDSALPPVAHW